VGGLGDEWTATETGWRQPAPTTDDTDRDVHWLEKGALVFVARALAACR